ncbi:hypothetical protein [Henriciella marina]|uniref:Uncharacterized protein n=1 Tax=Henriciella marina TaxID=453851 RepID=A0ABT4LY15_9PROT|nr:hypothetical protein [Henriciella marina]MCZ4299269.1 hypothetical protein [Henriciella marina]
MILRRLAMSIRKQDWFTVLIETLIVVLGVFLGIQVANWNDARIERSMERQYLVRLHDDMQRSAVAIRNSNTFLAGQVENEGVLLSSLKSCEIAEADRSAVVAALGSLGKYNFAVVDRDLVDQLRASGQFDVISNRKVREAINLMSQESDGQLRVEPQWLEHATPWTNYARRFYYFDSPEEVDSGRWESWENLQFDVGTACQDFEFKAAVGNTREATRNLYHWNGAVLARVVQAERALAEELVTRGWDDTR